MNDQLKISPPWVTYINKVKALFGEDKDIRIEADDNIPSVKLYVANARKAVALKELIHASVTFGNVLCQVTVVPGNGDAGEFKNVVEKVMVAFEGNPVVAKVRQVSKGLFQNLAYVAFRKDVVQFFDDDLSDINGNWSGLYADIAKEIMTDADCVFFCTAADNGFGAPLGEWP